MLKFQYYNQLFFIALPYVALAFFFFGTILRYREQRFTYSSLSSQFLENKLHFWALVPFHYGVITVLTGHFVAFLAPSLILKWNGAPLRLYILESFALAAGFFTLIGLILIIERRLINAKVKTITSVLDWAVYALLAYQVATGIYIAVFHPWGSSWFASLAAPYLWSILKLSPDMAFISGVPLLVKTHIINAFLIIGIFPFTRLVHILVVPNQYLWRKTQVVRWNRRRETA